VKTKKNMFEKNGYELIDLNFGFEDLIVKTFEETAREWQVSVVGDTNHNVSPLPLEIPMEILSRLVHRDYTTPIVEKITGLKLTPTYCLTRKYFKGSILGSHKDRNACEISLTYCISGPEWEIDMGDVTLITKKGNGVIYRGCDIQHGRSKPSSGEVIQIFNHWVISDGIRTKKAYVLGGGHTQNDELTADFYSNKPTRAPGHQVFSIFPVPVQISTLELDIDSLIEFCYEMKRKNEKGVEKPNTKGWQSNNIINETHTEFVKLKNKIEERINTYHKEIQLKEGLQQTISNIWVNIDQKGHSNDFHIHPQSILSGEFYLTKGKTAPIAFRHPFRDINTYFWDETIVANTNTLNSGEWEVDPKPNRLLVFPSWVYHKVRMNEEETDKISFSFDTQSIDASTEDLNGK